MIAMSFESTRMHSCALNALMQRLRALYALVQLSCTINALTCAKYTHTAHNEHVNFITNLPRHVRVCAFNCKLARELYCI